ncbi:unnamed protein product [Camellia sinensis]
MGALRGSWSGSSQIPSAVEKALVSQGKSGDWEIDKRLLKIGERIASGSCGDLYQGVYLGQDVAIKVLRSEHLNDALEDEFAQEVAVLREVQHRNVVRFVGACTKAPHLCIVTEVVKVADFGIARFQNQGGVMTAETGTRQAFTPEQINEACYVDINSNKAVFDSLRNNPKVNYDGRCFAYKSKHALKDKNQLLILIRKFPEGIAVIDLKDAYPTVMEDLQALKAAGQIWLLSNFDSQEDIAYPNDPRVPIKVDDDLKLLFQGIELPRDMIDIEKDLQKNGMKPATNTAKI